MSGSASCTDEVRPRLVLIGNGMAGMRTLEELLRLAPDMYDISVFGEEPYGNYNRIMLSPVLSGEQDVADIMLNDLDWYAAHRITLYKGHRVARIDRLRCEVVAESGLRRPYDRVLIATGSRPFIPPIPGADLDGVIGFRTIADVETMIDAASGQGDDRPRHCIVIGGGLLGLEAASGLRVRDMHVTVLHLGDNVMEQQLDSAAGRLLEKSLMERGIDVRLNALTQRILGEDGRVTGIQLSDGQTLPADLVVMSTGIRPNTEVALASGLHCERGIVVDDTLLSHDPKIYAVGECAEHRGATYGLVAPLFEQARVCANHLAGLGNARYGGSVLSTKLKVTGIDVFSAGAIRADDGAEEVVFADSTRGVYKKLVLRGNRVEGAVMFGDTRDGPWYFQLMREATDVTDMREQLLFGQAHCANREATGASGDGGMSGCNSVGNGVPGPDRPSMNAAGTGWFEPARLEHLDVTRVEAGYELRIGGQNGRTDHATGILCKASSEAQLSELTNALLQLHREEAHYLEGTGAWIERVGPCYVRRRLLEDPVGRKGLSERFGRTRHGAHQVCAIGNPSPALRELP